MFDVAILGGGISGLGVARAVSEKGYSVVVLEARQVASATSNNTLRIIHGGFRYLQSLDFSRMIRSMRDQRDLLLEVPDSVQILPCLMPLNRFGLKSMLPVWCAGQLYGMSLRAVHSPVPGPRVLSAKAAEECSPFLKGRCSFGALEWSDVLMQSPNTIAVHLKNILLHRKVEVRENSPVSAVIRDGDKWNISTRDNESLNARSVVSTLGPWIDSIKQPDDVPRYKGGWCKGINITINRCIDPNYAIGIESDENRLFFIVPRDGKSCIGTWYVPTNTPNETPAVTSEELKTFITAINRVLPQDPISISNVETVDVGVLPMKEVNQRGPVLQGNESLLAADGFVNVVSTKYTTFRSQGEAVLSLIRKQLV